MANLYEYAESNDKTGYFLKGLSNTSGYYNLQTTPIAEQLFDHMGYTPGRVNYTEGDHVPGELTWRMYQANLLTTENSDSPLDNLSERELKNAFANSEEQPTLSNTDLSKLESFIETHARNGNSRISKLGKLLGTIQGASLSTNSSSQTASNTNEEKNLRDEPFAIERAEAANTTIKELQNQITELENRDDTNFHPTQEEILAHPGGPQSFQMFWHHPAWISNLWGSDILDDKGTTFDYLVSYPTDLVEDLQFLISDFTITAPPDGEPDAYVGAFQTQVEAARTECEYQVSFAESYDPVYIPGEDVFDLYLGEKPLMSHYIDIEEGRINAWSVKIKGHEWTTSLRLKAVQAAGKYLSITADFFEDMDRYHLESPAQDFDALSIDFQKEEISEEMREQFREIKEEAE